MAADSPADLPSRVLVVRRTRELRRWLSVVGFTVAGVILTLSSGVESKVVGVAAIVFFGGLGIPLLAAQMLRPPRLELDATGFTLSQLPRRTFRRSWGEVSHFTATGVNVPGPFGLRRTRPVLISYSTSRQDKAQLRRVNRWTTNGDEGLPTGFGGMGAAQLAELLNHYRDTARSTDRHYFS